MAVNIITSNIGMRLPIPGVTEAVGIAPVGESWMELQNLALLALDAHDHSPGRGAPLSSGGISVDRDFDLRAFNAVRVRSLRFEANALAADVNLATDRQCIFFAGGNFYVRDLAGNAIRVTNNGNVDVSVSGGWTGLSVPAAASYVAGAFSLITNTGIWGDLYAASVGIGQHGLNDAGAAAGGFRVQLRAGALAANYALTFPTALPNPVSAEAALDADNGSTLKTRALFVKQDGAMVWGQSGSSQIADSSITNTKLGSAAVTSSKIGAGEVKTSNIEDYTSGSTGVTTAKIAAGAVTNSKQSFGTPVNPEDVVIKSYLDANYSGDAGWTQIGATGVYYASRNGLLRLRGVVTAAAGSAGIGSAGAIPVGSRPVAGKTFIVGWGPGQFVGPGPVTVTVSSAGTVTINNASDATVPDVSLDPVAYFVEV